LEFVDFGFLMVMIFYLTMSVVDLAVADHPMEEHVF
jgi:hypothetical protein